MDGGILAVFGIIGLALAVLYVWGLYVVRPDRRRSAPAEMYPRWKVAASGETAADSASGAHRRSSTPAEMYPRWKV
jgi:hypothetical protein